MTAPTGYFEVTAPPGEDLQLQENDIVNATYDLFQTGQWYVDYVVGKLEKQYEDDGRFEAIAYGYNADAKTLTVDTRIKAVSEMPDKVRLTLPQPPYEAGTVPVRWIVALSALLGVSLTVLSIMAYTYAKEVHVYRRNPVIQDVMDDPNFPQEKKDAIRELEAQAAQSQGLAASIGKAGTGLALLAVAVIAYIVLGGSK